MQVRGLGVALSAHEGEPVVSHVAFRQNRRGRVARVVRERYLRDDVGFGRLAGRAALHDERELGVALGDEFIDSKGLRTLLVLDTNVALRQIDVLEREDCAAFHNVVLCDTVLRETKHLNLGVYNRLLVLLRDDKRCFIEFPNENHRETWSPQQQGESMNDYNDRLIRDTARWFANQVEPCSIASVLFLTNDRDSRQKAKNEGLNTQSIQKFVHSIAAKYPGIVDLVADAQESTVEVVGERVARFDAHLSLAEINRRLKAGTLVQGTFRASPFNSTEGSVMVHTKKDSAGKKIVIRGRQLINRAFDGDRVAVQLIDKQEGEEAGAEKDAGPEASGDQQGNDDELFEPPASDPSQATMDGTEAATSKDKTDAAHLGKVVGIIKRCWRQYCGSVDEKDAQRIVQSENVLVLPVDPKIPKIRIRTKQLEAIKNQRILVSVDSWDRFSSFPNGHFVRALGPIGDRQTETAVILHEHDIPTKEFSRKVLKCLPREGKDWKVTSENSKGRTDLRHLNVCSIDPPGCKDIDDALHVRQLENGNIELGVHIADVTHFVRPGTEIDKEAANRGTSTYLVERRLDMFPGLLTTDICSLVGKVDRFAFSVLCEFTPPTEEGKVQSGPGKVGDDDGRGAQLVDAKFCKSIIHSKAALSYGEAQAWLEDPSVSGELPDSVRLMNRIAKILRDRRTEAGALTLASQEVRFKLDDEGHDPTDVQMYEQKEANQLVETFMLLANIQVAKRITQAYPQIAMLRRHPKPSREMFKELLAATEIAGVKINVDSSKELADSLDKAVKPGMPFFNKLIRIMTTRCMMQAVYFSSGDIDPAEYRHYGLASDIYTHFTSPIRRYPDVVAHRLLAAAEGIDPLPVEYESKEEGVKAIADQCNKRHYNAMLAGRASSALHTVVFFRNRETIATALVSRVREKGVVVVVPDFGIEGKIALAKTNQDAQDNFLFDESKMKIVHKATKLSLQIFDQIKVRIFVETRVGHRQVLQIGLIQPAIPVPGIPSKKDEDVPVSKSSTVPTRSTSRKRTTTSETNSEDTKKKKGKKRRKT